MKGRQARSLIVVLLLLTALAVTLTNYPVTPPKVEAANLTVTLTPNSGKSGDVILVHATGATVAQGTTCSITANVANLIVSPTASVSSGSDVDGSFTVGNAPQPSGGGSYTVTVRCPASGTPFDSGTATFTVSPKLTVNPSIGTTGQQVSVTGVGFRSDASTCILSSNPGGLFAGSPAPFCSISGGSVTAAFAVEATAGTGFKDITVFPNVGAVVTLVNGFQKVTAPTIDVFPDGGAGERAPVGFGTADGTVIVFGGGFATGSARSCTLSSNSPLFATTPTPTCSISAAGTVTGSFAVSATAGSGAYTVTVTDTNPAGVFDSTSFTVSPQPTISLGAASSPAGTTVGITQGANLFSELDQGACAISSTPTGLFSSYACFIGPGGVLIAPTTSFVVSPTAPGQSYSVTVTPLHGDKSAVAGFIVTPAVTFNPTSGFPPIIGPPTATGTEITVAGTGFSTADTTCTITSASASLIIDTSGLPACTVNSLGQLSAKFKIGANSVFTGAAVTVTVTGNPGGDSAAASVTVNPRIVLSPTSGASGIQVNFAGSGFKNVAGSAFPCIGPGAGTITGTPVANPTSCSQDSNGNVAGFFTVGAVPSGSYFITYSDFGGAFPSAIASFIVTGGPIVIFTPSLGPTGTTVTVAGSGWNPLDTSVSFVTTAGPTDLFDPPTTRTCPVSGGNIGSCSFTVKSNAHGGTYTVTFTGNQGDQAAAQFIVQSTLVVTPDNGGMGITVQLSGSGYIPPGAPPFDCHGFLSFNPDEPFITVAATCSIDGNGLLTGGLTVASSGVNPGPHTITLTDSHVVQGSVWDVFTVKTPSITLTPSSGSGGDVIQVTGSGFSTGDTGCTISAPANVIEGTPSCSISGGVVTGSFVVKIAGNARAVLTNAIQVTGGLGDRAVQTFTVNNKIVLNPTTAAAGMVVTITGSNFAAGDGGLPCTLTSLPPGVITAGVCNIDANLMVSGSFTVGGVTPGSYIITVTGTGPPASSASATLTVVQRLVTLSPSVGPPGSVVTVTGAGFSPSDTSCTITVPTIAIGSSCAVTPAGSGNIQGTFTVSNFAPPGVYLVTVTGTPTSDVGTSAFTVAFLVTVTTTSTSFTSTSTVTTSITTTITSTGISTSFSTTTFSSTGVSTETNYAFTMTTVSGQSTVSYSTTSTTTALSTFVTTSTSTTRTTTTYNPVTGGSQVAPTFNYAQANVSAFGLIALLTLLAPAVLRRFLV